MTREQQRLWISIALGTVEERWQARIGTAAGRSRDGMDSVVFRDNPELAVGHE